MKIKVVAPPKRKELHYSLLLLVLIVLCFTFLSLLILSRHQCWILDRTWLSHHRSLWL
ncbi:hypothetical protein GYH30_049717 [Glycine max]|nr:hypothetical protein GYH30_049717 [Glycine max]